MASATAPMATSTWPSASSTAPRSLTPGRRRRRHPSKSCAFGPWRRAPWAARVRPDATGIAVGPLPYPGVTGAEGGFSFIRRTPTRPVTGLQALFAPPLRLEIPRLRLLAGAPPVLIQPVAEGGHRVGLQGYAGRSAGRHHAEASRGRWCCARARRRRRRCWCRLPPGFVRGRRRQPTPRRSRGRRCRC